MLMIDRAAHRVAQALALCGAVGVLAMLVHVFADVALRNVAGRPIPATNDIVSRYYMVLIAFLPLAWVEQRRAMVAVEFIEPLMTPLLTRISDVLVALLSTLVYGTIAWVTLGTALQNLSVGSFVDVLGYRVPVWPSYFFPPLGFLLAALVTLLRGAQRLAGAAP